MTKSTTLISLFVRSVPQDGGTLAFPSFSYLYFSFTTHPTVPYPRPLLSFLSRGR